MAYNIYGPLTGGTKLLPALVYGNTSGDDTIDIFGAYNKVYSQGANDQITDNGTGSSNIYLGGNAVYNGFTGVTDSVNLGSATFDNVLTESHPLTDATVSVSGGAGNNTVNITNNSASPASNTINLTGYYNTIDVNGDATNVLSAGSGHGTINVTGLVANNAYLSTVNDAGQYNTVTGGNEQFVITGGQGYDTDTLGNGDNNITEAGQRDKINVGTGSNTILIKTSAGNPGGYTALTFNGVVNNGHPFGPWVTENVTLGGIGNTLQEVPAAGASSRNFNITGSTGHSIFVVGDGDNYLSATGSNNFVSMGTANNPGNPNAVPYGDKVTVTGGNDNTITLGNGNNVVTASTGAANTDGNSDKVTLGTGNNTLVANGSDNTVTVGVGGTGSNNVTANGDGDKITLGDGNNSLHSNGNSDTVILGDGTNNVTATGYDDTITSATGGSGSFTIGSNSVLDLSASKVGTTVNATGPQDQITLMQNANATINDGPLAPTSGLTVELDAVANKYNGNVTINGLQNDPNATLNLFGFGVSNVTAFTLSSDGAGGTKISFAPGFGTGSVDLTNTTINHIAINVT